MSEISQITRLREERAASIAEMRRILDAADAESRENTAEESAEYEKREAAVDRLDAEIEKRERFAKLQPAAGFAAEATIAETGEERGGRDDNKKAPSAKTETPEYRQAFKAYLRGTLSPDEARALTVGTNSQGGYTVPRAFYGDVVASMRQFGFVRNLATVLETAAGNPLDIPTSSSFGTSGWGTEGGAYTQSDPAFGTVALSAYKSNHLTLLSEELIQDTGIDLEGFLAARLGENLALLQNTAYVVGNGTGRPTGIFDATAGAATGYTAANTTSQVTAIAADSLFEIYHSLAPQYRGTATWLMHDASAKIIRKLKDTTNQYLWQPGMAAGQPDTLFSRPVVIDPDVPQMAASTRSIGFGDIRRGYFIRSAGGISIQRLNERYADTGQIAFRVYERVDGKIVDVNAIRLFINAAS